MKKLLIALLLSVTSASFAGVITRPNDYTPGDVIRSADVDLNETTIYTEFNGGIDSDNIENGSVATGDLADGAVTLAKTASVIQSTFPHVNNINNYVRPTLVFQSVTTVDIATNTATSNRTCLMFPDEMRCVTENVATTSVNRRFIITETASNTGTKNSGMYGSAEANNTFYYLYGWKVADNSTDFVIAGSTNAPNVVADIARLDAMFGARQWVYLGFIRNGDFAGAPGDILSFTDSGNVKYLRNTVGSGDTSQALTLSGIVYDNSASNTVLTVTLSRGTGGASIPHVVGNAQVCIAGDSNTIQLQDAAGARNYLYQPTGAAQTVVCSWMPVDDGFRLQKTGGADNITLWIRAYDDVVIGGGHHPSF
jgi:hypothetical protein